MAKLGFARLHHSKSQGLVKKYRPFTWRAAAKSMLRRVTLRAFGLHEFSVETRDL